MNDTQTDLLAQPPPRRRSWKFITTVALSTQVIACPVHLWP